MKIHSKQEIEPVNTRMTELQPTGEQIKGDGSDEIDPALLRADPPVKFRAMLQRGIGEEG